MCMPKARVEGTTLFYEDLGGDGPLCLLGHGGLGLDHTYFRPDWDRLSSAFRVVYYDQRCNGRSERAPLESLTIPQLADDAVALADHLGAGPFLFAGHSYGGFVGQELALRHPDRILGLLLVDTTPGQLGETEPPDAPQGEPPPMAMLELLNGANLDTDDDLAEMMRRLAPFYVHSLEPADLLAGLGEMIFSAAAMVRSMEVLAEWSSFDRLGEIRCPVLVAAGAHDNFTSSAQAVRIAGRVPGAELRIFEESGHFPWLEEPDAFWDLVEAWLRRHELAEGRRPTSA